MLHRSVKIWHVWCLFCLSLIQPRCLLLPCYYSRVSWECWPCSPGSHHHMCISVCVLSYQVFTYHRAVAPGLSHVHSEEIIFTVKSNLLLNQHVRFPSCGCEVFQSINDSHGFGCNRSIPPETPFWIKGELWSYSYSLHSNSTAVITKIIGSVSFLWEEGEVLRRYFEDLLYLKM